MIVSIGLLCLKEVAEDWVPAGLLGHDVSCEKDWRKNVTLFVLGVLVEAIPQLCVYD